MSRCTEPSSRARTTAAWMLLESHAPAYGVRPVTLGESRRGACKSPGGTTAPRGLGLGASRDPQRHSKAQFFRAPELVAVRLKDGAPLRCVAIDLGCDGGKGVTWEHGLGSGGRKGRSRCRR